MVILAGIIRANHNAPGLHILLGPIREKRGRAVKIHKPVMQRLSAGLVHVSDFKDTAHSSSTHSSSMKRAASMALSIFCWENW